MMSIRNFYKYLFSLAIIFNIICAFSYYSQDQVVVVTTYLDRNGNGTKLPEKNEHKDEPVCGISWEEMHYDFVQNCKHSASCNNNKNSNNHKKHLVRMLENERKNVFGNSPEQYDRLGHLENFADEKFVTSARQLKCYDEFILWLDNKIKTDQKFCKKLKNVKGFDTWEFQYFIDDEADRIIKKREEIRKEEIRISELKKKPRLQLESDNSPNLLLQNAKNKRRDVSRENDLYRRYTRRIESIDSFLMYKNYNFDYYSKVKHPKFTDSHADVFENCYGTRLDMLLHEELCETRLSMMELQENYADDLHVNAFAEIVFQATAKAKVEPNIEKAFSLSDFSADLVSIVSGGINLIKKGFTAANDVRKKIDNFNMRSDRALVSAAGIITDPQHWINMGKAVFNLSSILVKRASLNLDLWNARLSGDVAQYNRAIEAARAFESALGQAIWHDLQQKLEAVGKMSWGEIYEKGVCHGIVLFIDGIMINAATLATTSAGQALVKQAAKALNSSSSEVLAIEAAGIAKLTVEEGVDVVEMAMETIEKNPELISLDKSLTQAIQEVTKDEGSNLANQTTSQLLKSKASYEKLIREHEEKLAAYISNPDKCDNLEVLKNVSAEMRQERISGRVIALQKQIRKQQYNLSKINKLLASKE